VTTRTSTRPAERFGLVTVNELSETTFTSVPAVDPNRTFDIATKFDPLIVTLVPPFVEPVLADTLVTFGAGTYRNLACALAVLVPAGPVTFTSTVSEPEGATTLNWVSETTFTLVPALDPNTTLVTPVSPEPVNVTTAPPAVLPAAGDTIVINGTAAA
jgi:hypothetical protein